MEVPSSNASRITPDSRRGIWSLAFCFVLLLVGQGSAWKRQLQREIWVGFEGRELTIVDHLEGGLSGRVSVREPLELDPSANGMVTSIEPGERGFQVPRASSFRIVSRMGPPLWRSFPISPLGQNLEGAEVVVHLGPAWKFLGVTGGGFSRNGWFDAWSWGFLVFLGGLSLLLWFVVSPLAGACAFVGLAMLLPEFDGLILWGVLVLTMSCWWAAIEHKSSLGWKTLVLPAICLSAAFLWCAKITIDQLDRIQGGERFSDGIPLWVEHRILPAVSQSPFLLEMPRESQEPHDLALPQWQAGADTAYWMDPLFSPKGEYLGSVEGSQTMRILALDPFWAGVWRVLDVVLLWVLFSQCVKRIFRPWSNRPTKPSRWRWFVVGVVLAPSIVHGHRHPDGELVRHFHLPDSLGMTTEIKSYSGTIDLIPVPLISGEKTSNRLMIENGSAWLNVSRETCTEDSLTHRAWKRECQVFRSGSWIGVARRGERPTIHSRLDSGRTFMLRADSTRTWNEYWVFHSAPGWIQVFSDSSLVDPGTAGGSMEYHPPPGGTLIVRLRAATPVPAPNFQVEQCRFRFISDDGSKASLELRIAARDSGSVEFDLPKQRSNLQVSLNQTSTKPIVDIRGRTSIMLIPGTNDLILQWAMPPSRGGWWSTPSISMSIEAKNLLVELPRWAHAWLLHLDGPGSGPHCRRWIWLVAVGALAWFLSRQVPSNGIGSWFLVLSVPAMVQPWCMVTLLGGTCFLVMASRMKHPKSIQRDFTLLSMLAFFPTAFGFIWVMLEGWMDYSAPIRATTDHVWFVDQATGVLPTANMLVMPIWVWLVLLICWSLWSIRFLDRWVRSMHQLGQTEQNLPRCEDPDPIPPSPPSDPIKARRGRRRSP